MNITFLKQMKMLAPGYPHQQICRIKREVDAYALPAAKMNKARFILNRMKKSDKKTIIP
jgi:hypothetical protein